MNGENRLLRVREVAEFLGCSTSTVWRHVSEGLLPKPIKLGPNMTRWRLSDIEELIESAVAERDLG